jgi:PAS domain S-box-containing protein
VLLGSLLVTALVTFQVAASTAARDRLRFQNLVERTEDTIERRLETYTNLLRGGAALFVAAGSIDRRGFATYVQRLELPKHYPGIQGMGASILVRPGDEKLVAAQLRKQGVPGFRLWPRDYRGELHAIVYLEPFDRRNQAAIGFNMFSEPTRREAMRRARDTGVPTASGKVTLVQEIEGKPQAGFLIYVPIYQGGGIPATVAARRTAFAGFIYSPFRADDLFHGTFGAERELKISIQIFDNTAAVPAALLHASDGAQAESSHRPQLESIRRTQVANRPWTIRYATRPGFEEASPVSITFISGLVISGLLFFTTWFQMRKREDAEASTMALRETEARFRLMADSAPVLIWMSDTENRGTWFNRPWLEFTGRSMARELGFGWSEAVHPDDLERSLATCVEAFRKRQPFTMEFRLKRHDGAWRWVLDTGIPLHSSEGEFTGYIGSCIDITERREAEEGLREAIRHKDEFLAMLAHELRNPLGAMSNALHVMKHTAPGSSRFQRAQESAARQVTHQARLVSDLLDVSRIIRGKLELRKEQLDLTRLVTETAEDHRSIFEEKGLTLSMDAPEGMVPVLGDRTRLSQVITNLLDNAAKFTPTGGTVRVTVTGGTSGTVCVSDSGMGIDPELLPHIFDAFTQADQALDRSRGGLGLGLTLVKGLVELHDGTASATSEGLEQGADFSFTLPLAEERPVIPELPATALQLKGNLRILVVEDSRDAAETLRDLLELYGYEVYLAYTGPEGVRAALELRPQIVVCDIGLPGMDGYEVATTLRGEPLTAEMRLIAVTGYGSEDDRRRSREAGFEAHLTKPLDLGELERLLAE